MTYMALYLCIIIVSQMALSFLINIQLVYLLFVLFLHTNGLKKTLLLSILFAIMMGMIYGFGYYILGYLYIYPVLLILTHILSYKKRNPLYLAMIGLLCGFLFGFLFSIQDSYLYKIPFSIYYLRGLPYDVIHGLSNFFTVWILYPILYKIEQRAN